jgi:hypothetical protein
LASRLFFELFLFALLRPSVAAQEDPCLTRTLMVNVFDGAGNPVKTLGKANFRAALRKQEVSIASVTYDTVPRRIVLLLDRNRSMVTVRAKWKAAFAVAEALVTWAPPQTSFAALTFANHVEDKISFNQGRSSVVEELAKLKSTRWEEIKGERTTAVLDALLEGMSLLQHARPGDAICLISDAAGNTNQSHQSQVRQAFLASGVRLFTFIPLDNLGTRERTPEEVAGPEGVRELAKDTGGSFCAMPAFWDHTGFDSTGNAELTPQDREALVSVARTLLVGMTESYRVQIKLPEPVEKTRRWELEVVTADGKRNSHLQIIYPRLLAPCQTK